MGGLVVFGRHGDVILQMFAPRLPPRLCVSASILRSEPRAWLDVFGVVDIHWDAMVGVHAGQQVVDLRIILLQIVGRSESCGRLPGTRNYSRTTSAWPRPNTRSGSSTRTAPSTCSSPWRLCTPPESLRPASDPPA